MTIDPVLIAYAITRRPGQKSIWRRIGATFPNDNGLAVILNALHIAIEVKSGRVCYRSGLRQQLSGGQRWQKRIEPWGQAQRALAQVCAVLGLNSLAIPQAFMLAMPAMRRDGFPFAPGPHMLTEEDLAPAALARKLDALLPRLNPATSAALAPAFESIAASLTRPADEKLDN